jgi:hypothetical protein
MSYRVVGGLKLNSVLVPYSSASPTPELEKALLNSDNRAGHSYTGVHKAMPMIRFTTQALKSVLDITGLVGAVLTAAEVHLIKNDAVAVASGSAHRKISMTAAVAQIESITTSKGHAELNVVVHGVYDGTNAVWVNDNAAALATSPPVTDVWYQGPLYLTTTLYRVEQSTVTPNAEVLKRHSNGEVGPGFVGLKQPAPTIGVSAADGILHGLAGAFGANVGPITMFYRKGAEGSGLRVADATETHIKLVVPSAFMTGDGVDGQPRTEVDFGVMFDVRDDGTNAIWTLDTTAAIVAPS